MPQKTKSRRADAAPATPIRFDATLMTPRTKKPVTWAFLRLPKEASAKLPSRAKASIEGTLNGEHFTATLDPDGEGGHWLRVERQLREKAGVKTGNIVTLEIAPVAVEPEPKLSADLKKALAAAPAKARELWLEITAMARRDYVHWIESAKQAETRARRIEKACDMLAHGKRRPCCFDRSGMYDKSLSCPVAEGE